MRSIEKKHARSKQSAKRKKIKTKEIEEEGEEG